MTEYLFEHTYDSIFRELQKRLLESAPARVQIVTGPRQVGKTTLLLELCAALKERALYLAADAPEAALPGWWEIQWDKAQKMASQEKSAIMLDEIHYLPGWSRLLKAKSDEIRRKKIPLHIIVSGSSSMHLALGSREAMTGRYEKLALLHWPVAELARVFGLMPEEAVPKSLIFGCFPGAVGLWNDFGRWKAYIRDSIMEPAIGRDIMVLQTIRRPALMRQVFALCVGHPAEIISLQKLAGQLQDKGALETIAHYLFLLEEAALIAALPKYSPRMLRQRSSPPKLISLNQAFLSTGSAGPPQPADDPLRWGRWVENACLAFAWNCGQKTYYWREEPHEVDGIFEGSWGKWAVEVKTGPYTTADLAGLMEFCQRYPSYRPLVICDAGRETTTQRLNIRGISWDRFLFSGL